MLSCRSLLPRLAVRTPVLALSCLLSMAPALAASTADREPTPLHLTEVWQRVDEANADVLTARRNVDAADADRTSARVTPPTQFSLLSQSIDPNHMAGDLWHKPIDTIARLDHTIERGGKLDLRDAVAQAGAQASRADLQEARRAQRVAASLAFWDLKLAQEQLDTSLRHAQLSMESSRLAQIRLQQGDLSRLEATRLAVEADRAQNDVSSARLNLHQAQLALAQLMHSVDKADVLHAEDPWPVVAAAPAAAQDGDLDAWLASRPDVQAAQARVNQAEQALALADAQRVTDVTVSVQFEHNPVVADRLWGVGVAFPLGMDGRQDGPARKALIARDEAQAQLDRVRQQALSDRALQWAAIDDARHRIERLDQQLLPQAREALQAAEFARQQGAIGLQDVLDARRALHAAELDSSSAHADLAKAWSALNTPESQP